MRYTSKEYTEANATLCPCCGSRDIEGDCLDVIDRKVYQTIWCHDCGASWEDVYRLVGYENLKECRE